MELINPSWIHHQGGAIYSVDIHPTLEKLVTCGQGNVGGAGIITVWALGPVLSEKAHSEGRPKCLCVIQETSGVNSVRWSRNGQFLACANDNRTVSILEYGGRVQSAGTIGAKNSANANHEKYRTAHTMHGHAMEVLQVEWSPNGKFLASCSMDHNVIVWNAERLPERVALLGDTRNGHTAPVKGLSWDPVGRYLATQGADKSLRIWTTDAWKCERTITKPFEESSQTCLFSRLDWTPDGAYLITPCAMNNEGPTAHLIRRKDWDISLDLVGHRKAVTAVKASPRLIDYKNHKGQRLQVACVAVGARDKTLSLWLIPGVMRPFVVIRNVFRHSILDFSWKGLTLVACSMDGTVKAFKMAEKKLGRMLSLTEMGDYCEKIYRTRPIQYTVEGAEHIATTTTAPKNTFINTPEALIASRKAAETPKTNGEATVVEKPKEIVNKAVAELVEKRKEQIEVRGKDGKRRIQPIFLCSTVSDEPEPAPVVKPVPAVEKTTKTITATTSSNAEKEPPKKKIRLEEEEREGDAHVGDELIASPSKGLNAVERDRLRTLEKKFAELSSVPPILAANFEKPSLRDVGDTVGVAETSSAPTLKTPYPTPEQRKQLSIAIKDDLRGKTWTFEVENEALVASGVRATVVKLRDTVATSSDSIHDKIKSAIWTTRLAPSVSTVAGNKRWLACGAFNRQVFVFTSTGRLTLTLTLDSVPARMELSNDFLVVLTAAGFVYSWNLEKKCAALKRQSVLDCLVKDATLSGLAVSNAGAPLLSFSDSSLFTFNTDLDAWQLVDSRTVLNRLLDPLVQSELGDGLLGSSLLKRQRAAGVAPITLNAASSELRAQTSETRLETLLAGAEALGSARDYRNLFSTYATQLVANGSTEKLRELLISVRDEGRLCGCLKSELRVVVQKALETSPQVKASLETVLNRRLL